jgi:hypothetical protein
VPLRFRCPACQGVISATDDQAGQVVACPGCTRGVRLPGTPPPATYRLAAEPPPQVLVPPPVRVPPPVKTVAVEEPTPDDDADDDDIDVPPRRRKGPPTLLIASGAVLFLVGAVGVLAYAVWNDTNTKPAADRPATGGEPAHKGSAAPAPADPARRKEPAVPEPGVGLPRWGESSPAAKSDRKKAPGEGDPK